MLEIDNERILFCGQYNNNDVDKTCTSVVGLATKSESCIHVQSIYGYASVKYGRSQKLNTLKQLESGQIIVAGSHAVSKGSMYYEAFIGFIDIVGSVISITSQTIIEPISAGIVSVIDLSNNRFFCYANLIMFTKYLLLVEVSM